MRPTTSAVRSWDCACRRPVSTSSGQSRRAESARPIGPYTSASRTASTGSCSRPPASLTSSHAIATELADGVRQLARVLHQEARLAHELVWSLRDHGRGRLAPFLGLRGFVLVVVLG